MKKALKITGVVLGVLLLLVGGSVVLLRQSKVQTYIIQRVSERLSKQLDAEVRIGRIYYQPLSRLTVDSLYVSDRQRDTLAFIEHTYIRFHPLLLRQKRLDLTQVEFYNPYLNIQKRDSTLNCQFLIDWLRTDSTEFPLRVNIDRLTMSDMRVRYKNLLADKVNMDITLPVLSSDSVDIAIQSLSLRAQLDRFDAQFEATLRGDLDSLFADKLQLVYRGQRMFAGDVAVYNPLDLKELSVRADCEDLFCNHALLQDMLSQLLRKPVRLPHPVANLGQVHYRGKVYGRLENMQLRGAFSSALGTVTVNGDARTDTTLQHYAFCGRVSTRRFRVGKLLNNKDIGSVTLAAHVDGRMGVNEPLTCVADARIERIDYKNYAYKNVRFDGQFADEEVSGSLHIDDENIGLQLEGLMDLSEQDTRIDGKLHLSHFRPGAMHLTERYPQLEVEGKAYVSLFAAGKTLTQLLDKTTGYLIVDSLRLQNAEQQALMTQLKVEFDSQEEEGVQAHKLQVQSDYLNARLSGEYSYNTLPATIKDFIAQYMPSAPIRKSEEPHQPNNVDFYAYFRNLETLADVFDLDISLPSFPTLKGFIRESDNQFGMQAYIPQVISPGVWMEDVTVALDNVGNRAGLSVYVLNHLPQDNPAALKIGDMRAYIDMTAKDDILGLTVRLDNTDSVRNEGTIRVSSRLQEYADRPLWDVHIHPTEIILNDSVWNISDAHVIYTAADKTLGIEHLRLSTQHQAIIAHGMASPHREDSIYVELKNIDVNYLLGYSGIEHALSVDGYLTGWANIYGLFSQPMFEAKCVMPSAGLNGVPLGRAVAEATWNREARRVEITGDVIDTTAHVVAHVDGLIKPEKRWELDIACDSVNLEIVNFWTKGILSDIRGLGYGNLHIDGHERETYITAGLYGKDAQLTVPQIGATFLFSDSVLMDSTAIRFPHITLHDAEGHTGFFEGALTHHLFEDFRYDMTATVNNMLVFDLPYDPQAMFYGKVHGSGNVHINGDEQECRIAVNARTEANTQFYLSVNTASTASSSSFVNFVQPDTTANDLLRLLHQQPPTAKRSWEPRKQEGSTRVILSLLIEATPTANVVLRMGGDDGLHGCGEGNLRVDYDDRTGDVQMLGTYTLQSGVFSFSLGNIVRRNFELAEGSRVIWNGDPTMPSVDVTGRYRVTASLRDLYGDDASQISTNRTSVPVNCVLHMTDQLFNPIISFAVELPQSDESVQSQVRSIINTNEMLMRQVIYLLAFNRFYTPEYLQNTKNVGLNETYSLLSSTITGQINAWLSKLTDVFSMGFNIRTDGEGSTASQEYEANFQIHPINQLLINGNFGYRYNDLSNRPFFGDLDVEYLLTENGKLRAKAYTHTVDKYSLRQANTVQGIGFVFKHDFNWRPLRKKNTSNTSSHAN